MQYWSLLQGELLHGPCKHDAERKETNTKGHTLHDLIYIKYPKRVSHRDTKWAGGCQRLETSGMGSDWGFPLG